MRPLERPPCPDCNMSMITTSTSAHDHRVFECLRCGLVETSADQLEREYQMRRRA